MQIINRLKTSWGYLDGSREFKKVQFDQRRKISRRLRKRVLRDKMHTSKLIAIRSIGSNTHNRESKKKLHKKVVEDLYVC